MKQITLLFFGCLVFLLSGVFASAAELSPNDCGSNLNQVKQIILSRHPHINERYMNRFTGRWTYPGINPVVLSEFKQFNIMGYDILVCPRANRTFVILWKREKTKAGVLSMRSKNALTISDTAMGTLELKREGHLMTTSR